MEFVFEPVVELVGHLVLGGLSATVGMLLAILTYNLWSTARYRRWQLDRPVNARSPDGGHHELRIPALRLRTPLARQLFGLREVGRDGVPRWDEDHWMHPDRLSARTDEALVLVVPFLLAGVIAAILLLIVELVLATLIVLVVALFTAVRRHEWTVVVTDHRHVEHVVPTPSLRAARRRRDELAVEIRSGDLSGLAGPVRDGA